VNAAVDPLHARFGNGIGDRRETAGVVGCEVENVLGDEREVQQVGIEIIGKHSARCHTEGAVTAGMGGKRGCRE